MTPQQQLDDFMLRLQQLRQAPHTGPAFASHARPHLAALLANLPPRYTEVLHGLLDRLESSALFAEESCSFSQTDLLNSLQLWADKARSQLA